MAVKKAGMYSSFNMQENIMVDFGLGRAAGITRLGGGRQPAGLR